HKWLCAPKGAAFLFARPEVQSLVQPLIVSWGWESLTPSSSRFVDWMQWTGTRDISAFLAVPDAIAFQADHNWPMVRQKCHDLAIEVRQRIIRLTGIPAIYPDSPDWYQQMGTVPLPESVDSCELKSALYDRFKIEIPLIEWNGKKLIRFSLQAYNTINDVLALEQALKYLLTT
ncbi:aminotransferase class V-fold PLP-dependent enzyme, partial [bacterium]|nr:aminotransferase class V-fold PLP-dependent enzyme [bacterium]